MVDYVNYVTNYWFAPLYLLAIFIVSFVLFKVYKTHQAYAAASFITFLVAVFFRVLGFIGDKILIVSIIVLISAVVWLWFAEKHEFP